MKIVVTGGSGFIGRALCQSLVLDGHQVTVLSRFPGEVRSFFEPSIAIVGWDGFTRGLWERTLEEADAVINLAGEPIADSRWTEDRKEAIRKSRIGTTRLLVQVIQRLPHRPSLLVNASGVGFYGPRDSTSVTEETSAGSGFLADLCVAWEQEAVQAEAFGLRVVLLRIGMVLGEDGGALPRMVLPFRVFLGGPVSPGDQWVSWIHRHDLIGLIHQALFNPKVSGPVNGVAPGAVTMREFCRTLGRILSRPSWLPIPEFALRLALGELATLLTTGQRVAPTAALRCGYVFRYPALEPALQAVLGQPSPVEKAKGVVP